MRWFAISVIALAATRAAADPTPTEKARAQKLFEDGRTYLGNKEYELACTAFEESQKADPAIGTELNIALCYEQWGHVAAAYAAYQEAERFAKLKFDARAKVAHDKLAELEAKVPHLAIDLPSDADPSAIYLFDGKETDRMALVGERRVEPGEHTIEARVPGQPAKTTRVTLGLGDHKQVTVIVPRPDVVVVETRGPRKAERLYGGIAAGVAGAAAITIGSIAALHARDDYDAAVKTCPQLACDTRTANTSANDARSRANEMTFVIGGGGLLIAAGAFLVLTSGGDKMESAHVAGLRVAPAIAADSLGVTIGGGW